MVFLGQQFQISLFGERNGWAVGILISGCPAGMTLREKDFEWHLLRRKKGAKGAVHRSELDIPRIMSGIKEGKTIGSPILIFFENSGILRQEKRGQACTPLPGIADFAAFSKFRGQNEFRYSEYLSERLTVGIVAAGVIARKIIHPVSISSRILEVAGIHGDQKEFDGALRNAERNGDTIGAIIECVAQGVPAGWGNPHFQSLNGMISHSIFSLPGIMGLEFGAGFESARMRGSEFIDHYVDKSGRTETNNCGGIQYGLSNGNDIVLRVAVSPTPQLPPPQPSIDLVSGNPASLNIEEEMETCMAFRYPVLIESMLASVLADTMLQNMSRTTVFQSNMSFEEDFSSGDKKPSKT